MPGGRTGKETESLATSKHYDLFDDDLEALTNANSDEVMMLYLTARCPYSYFTLG